MRIGLMVGCSILDLICLSRSLLTRFVAVLCRQSLAAMTAGARATAVSERVIAGPRRPSVAGGSFAPYRFDCCWNGIN
jgi:hypothetical protein